MRWLMVVCLCSLLFVGACKTLQESYVESHPNLPSYYKEAILKNKIMLGMSKDDVEASWWHPDDVIEGMRGETWFYRRFDGTIYAVLWFDDNDVLRRWKFYRRSRRR